MSIALLKAEPLILTIDEVTAEDIETLDAGAAYTQYLHEQTGNFEQKPLSDFVTIVSESINPQAQKYADQTFEYINLREVDDIYGYILIFRMSKGKDIGSSKHRFKKYDILFAKIMPSLANKKIALVTQDVTNAASTEFNLRKKTEVRALRSDHFTRQAACTGATGRQRISPSKLLELKIMVPPPVEKEFTLRTLAQSKQSDDLVQLVHNFPRERTFKAHSEFFDV